MHPSLDGEREQLSGLAKAMQPVYKNRQESKRPLPSGAKTRALRNVSGSVVSAAGVTESAVEPDPVPRGFGKSVEVSICGESEGQA